jgi:hypothetical protein
MPSGVPNNAALSIVATYRAEEGHTAQGQGGWYFQVTVVQLGHVLGYVREKLLTKPSFMMSAGERWGQKHGRIKGEQVLLLAAPDDSWDQIAAQVRAGDAKRRPVLRNRQWTESKAREVIGARLTVELRNAS